jgi:hypothetical protein
MVLTESASIYLAVKHGASEVTSRDIAMMNLVKAGLL